MGHAADDLEPRIYVACLAAYNSGWLHGAWIAVDDDADEVRTRIAAMLKASPVAGAEEWAIHDYEDFGGVEIAEYAGIERVVEVAAFLRSRGRLGGLVLEHVGGEVSAAERALDDQYRGLFSSLADCFEDLTEASMTVPEALRNDIDYEAMGRDAALNGEVFTLETGHNEVHVFWTR